MSKIGVLSHEYCAAAAFSQRINWALIYLKKRFLLAKNMDSSPEELAAYRTDLAALLAGLLVALGFASANPTAQENASRIPGALVVHLQ